MSKDTLDMTNPENVVAAFIAVQQNEQVLENRIESMRQQVESALSDLKFQLEIFARMTEKLLITGTEDKTVNKVTLEEYKELADQCRKEFMNELKKKIPITN
jgi:2C-methyl-D-erythritol 2,4-cyclodiphosphate synthase